MSNRNFYNFITPTVITNFIKLPIDVVLAAQATISSPATRDLPDQTKTSELFQPLVNFEVIKGIYSNKVCFKSTKNFAKKLEISGSSEFVRSYPAVITANHGESQSCFLLGSDDKTPKASYYINFVKTELAPVIYQPIPTILVTVSTKTVEIKTPLIVQCIRGHKSLPIELSLDWPPFKDLLITLAATTNSAGIDFSKVVPIKLSINQRKGLLWFQCNNNV